MKEAALDALESSPRHGEWVDVEVSGSDVPIHTWVVYQERSDNAPIVLASHEIFGLTDWIRGVADQLAADGFIAVAPDLLSGRGPGGGGTEAFGGRDAVVAAIQELPARERTDGLDAVRTYALSIPSGNGKLGVMGYCWGGTASFASAVSQPELNAAVVYYGTSPAEVSDYERIQAPVLGHDGGDDQRVNATVPAAREAMWALSRMRRSTTRGPATGSCEPKATARVRTCAPPSRPGPERSRSSENISRARRPLISGDSPDVRQPRVALQRCER